MMKSRFSIDQVEAILKQAESGTPVIKLCEENHISHVTFYRWRRKATSAATATPDVASAAASHIENLTAQ